jgi:hypothetical protein
MQLLFYRYNNVTVKHITFRNRSDELFHELAKHSFEAKIIKDSTILVHCIRSHYLKFHCMDPFFKVPYLQRYRKFIIDGQNKDKCSFAWSYFSIPPPTTSHKNWVAA